MSDTAAAAKVANKLLSSFYSSDFDRLFTKAYVELLLFEARIATLYSLLESGSLNPETETFIIQRINYMLETYDETLQNFDNKSHNKS